MHIHKESTGRCDVTIRSKRISFKYVSICTVIFLLITCNNPVGEVKSVVDEPAAPSYFASLSWHPAGNWIAATYIDSLDTDNDNRLDSFFYGTAIINAETGTIIPLAADYNMPSFSPDGEKIAFSMNGDIYYTELTRVDTPQVNINNMVRLTNSANNFYPSWSPDSEWLVFDSNLGNEASIWKRIWLMKIDSTVSRELPSVVSEFDGGEWRRPTWSPNGSDILHERFLGIGDGGTSIVICDTAGTNIRLLYSDRVAKKSPKYSPSGSKIAWNLVDEFGRASISIMNLNNQTSYEIAENGQSPAWSPTGNKIVYSYWVPYPEESIDGNGELWIRDIEPSGSARRLTHNNLKDR